MLLTMKTQRITRTLKRDAIDHRVTREVNTLQVHFTKPFISFSFFGGARKQIGLDKIAQNAYNHVKNYAAEDKLNHEVQHHHRGLGKDYRSVC